MVIWISRPFIYLDIAWHTYSFGEYEVTACDLASVKALGLPSSSVQVSKGPLDAGMPTGVGMLTVREKTLRDWEGYELLDIVLVFPDGLSQPLEAGVGYSSCHKTREDEDRGCHIGVFNALLKYRLGLLCACIYGVIEVFNNLGQHVPHAMLFTLFEGILISGSNPLMRLGFCPYDHSPRLVSACLFVSADCWA
ncbi:hypothetical protein Tco_0277965 [Tanacetum coccineum]